MSNCKGQVFRYRVSYFKTRGAICQTVRLTPLKRLSCSGCRECGAAMEAGDYSIEEEIVFPVALDHTILRLKYVVDCRMPDPGESNGHWEFEEVPEHNPKPGKKSR